MEYKKKILSKKEWIEILQNENITTKNSFNILKTVYEFEDQQGYSSEIGLKLGFKGKSPQSPINLEIGRFGQRIAKYYDIDLTIRENQKYKFWDLFFIGKDEGRMFLWKLRPEIINAFQEIIDKKGAVCAVNLLHSHHRR